VSRCGPMKSKRKPAPRTTRARRTAEEARREILDAAEKRLLAGGPDSIRLQQIAADVGVSHPAILHHFGSREGLVREVVQRAIESLERDVIQAFAEVQAAGPPTALEMIERAARMLVDKGHGRTMGWLLLSGQAPKGGDSRVRTIAEVAHRRRHELHPDDRSTPEDTLYRTLLVGLVIMGEAIAGPSLFASAGLGRDAGAPRRFHEWFARLAATAVTPSGAPARTT